MEPSYSSLLLQNAVQELTRLPGIGRKTALRLALHLLRQPAEIAKALGDSVIKLREEVRYCRNCHTISDSDLCVICSNPKRDHSTICVVEDIRDMMAIENTSQYNGLYHVLGGVISPMEGIGPGELKMESLFNKAALLETNEVILALPSTVEGDTTNFYLYKTLRNAEVTVTTIARGIPVGDELDYTDEITLGRSILNRQAYHGMGS
ncbi:MAG: recombination protein RecR [Bacteroidales bacterium]|nr:recombination protein RecR [Bacteroidales bacterium]